MVEWCCRLVDVVLWVGQAFALAADFCYGIDLNITADNIARLCCAAEYLEMSGRGNLIEAVMTYLQESGTLDSSEVPPRMHIVEMADPFSERPGVCRPV